MVIQGRRQLETTHWASKSFFYLLKHKISSEHLLGKKMSKDGGKAVDKVRVLYDPAASQAQHCLENYIRFVILAQLFTGQIGLLPTQRAGRGGGNSFPCRQLSYYEKRPR